MKILVVDDNVVSRRIIGSELTDGGYQIIEAEDGNNALRQLISVPDISLITLDVNMPDMDGYQVCAHLRSWEMNGNLAHRPKTGQILPVIFVTGDDTFEGRQRGFDAGATEFVIKGFKKGELLDKVNRILKPHRRMEGLTVLVADDDRIVQGILRAYLEEYGVSVITADNGLEAFNYLKSGEHPVDMMLTDMGMPEMDGEALCLAVRRELAMSDLPIIVLSAESDRSKSLHLLKSGATDYLVKPLVKEELFARLNVFLEVILLNRQLKAQVKELEQLNRLKDEFISICSHDLRSPLTGILGMSELLQGAENLNGTQQDMIGRIKNSGQFLLTLIHDLLEVGQIQSEKYTLKMDQLNLVELADQCVETANYTAFPKGVSLVFHRPDRLEPIDADRTAVTRILHNLLSNATKFTPSGGSIEVSIAEQPGETVVTVADTGVGIPEKDLEELFDRYHKTSRKGTAGELGTGLGLPIVKILIDNHGGRIEVDSEVGKGTTFRVYFPRKQAGC
ncbi:Response regulator [Sulfidibacter corallicola]|uniref:histidine kinase n=1 Tax=Sulfidibacter corallicola TaxID=2818388 RepID=A0A8A4TMK4_SULCO|nr:hybrid sensor histidine kinase/response regulator [Sulfidibacter corallicola]QTD47825.1 response regulator [Sulfidibacter corallicola]